MINKVLLNLSRWLVLFSALSYVPMYSQTTIFVKRTKIVNNGSVRNVNDDGHYLTFYNDVCYVSDADGYAVGDDKLDYYRTDGDIDCYYGNAGFGPCHFFVASNRSRINEKRGDIIYVYEKCSPSTQVARRKIVKKQVMPETTVPTVTHDSPKPQQPVRIKTQRRTCLSCNGTGRLPDRKEYGIQYDPTEEKWCDICNEVTFIHTHRKPLCPACYGKGYIE